jgi:hypothetical protein
MDPRAKAAGEDYHVCRLDTYNWEWNVRAAVAAKIIPYVGHSALELVDDLLQLLLNCEVPTNRLPSHLKGWRRVDQSIAPITRVGVFKGELSEPNLNCWPSPLAPNL